MWSNSVNETQTSRNECLHQQIQLDIQNISKFGDKV